MPRGSQPGERRGGRQRGTPNKKTLLKNAVFLAAAADPNRSPLEFMLALMRDPQVPLDDRIDMAAAAAPLVHPRPRVSRHGPHPMEIRRQRARAAIRGWVDSAHLGGDQNSTGPGGEPKSPGSGVAEKAAAGTGGEKHSVAGEGKMQASLTIIAPQADGGGDLSRLDPLNFLLGVMCDAEATSEQRVRAARIAARYKHRQPERPADLVEDEYGFKIDPMVAKAVREIKIQSGESHKEPRLADWLREHIEPIDCPDGYNGLELKNDEQRLAKFNERRALKAKLTAEEAAEEAYLITRAEVYRATPKHQAWCRMAELEKYRTLGYSLTTEELAELEGLRARFPVLAQQVDRIDVIEEDSSFWLLIHQKRVEARVRGVELTKEQESKAVIEEVRQANLAAKRQISDDKKPQKHWLEQHREKRAREEALKKNSN